MTTMVWDPDFDEKELRGLQAKHDELRWERVRLRWSAKHADKIPTFMGIPIYDWQRQVLDQLVTRGSAAVLIDYETNEGRVGRMEFDVEGPASRLIFIDEGGSYPVQQAGEGQTQDFFADPWMKLDIKPESDKLPRLKDIHWHQCDHCFVSWRHDTYSKKTQADPKKAHTCPNCGRTQLNRKDPKRRWS